MIKKKKRNGEVEGGRGGRGEEEGGEEEEKERGKEGGTLLFSASFLSFLSDFTTQILPSKLWNEAKREASKLRESKS